jgi:S-(hydroxymethyl)glutathione dehydrogenase/alcohol dehydrogenase
MIEAKAYVLRKTGEIPSLEDIRVSDDLKPGQVMLRVLYSGLCATQMEEIFVSSRNAKYMPHLFGHEGVGVVEALGPGVKTKKLGDICVIHWRPSSIGMDSEPGDYFVNQTKISSGKVVTFSTRVIVPENRITPLPQGFPVDRGALLGCSMTTGWGSVVRVGSHSSGDRVLVIGLGAVGTFAAWTARLLGSIEVVGVDPKPEIQTSFSDRGVNELFRDLSELDRQQGEFSRLEGFDLAIDTSGKTDVIERLIAGLPSKARLVLVGMPSSSSWPLLDVQKLLDGLQLLGSNGGRADPGDDISVVGRLMADLFQKELSTSIGICRHDELELATNKFRQGSKLRIILTMAGE